MTPANATNRAQTDKNPIRISQMMMRFLADFQSYDGRSNHSDSANDIGRDFGFQMCTI